MNYLAKYCSLFLFNLLMLVNVFGFASLEDEKVILEITDKYNEVYLGITESSVFMILSNQIRDLANEQFDIQYKEDQSFFDDSNGNFIMSSATSLTSNRIEYSFDEIEDIYFEQGKLYFTYRKRKEAFFEEIKSYKSRNVLDNFYIEDLELFAITYNRLS